VVEIDEVEIEGARDQGPGGDRGLGLGIGGVDRGRHQGNDRDLIGDEVVRGIDPNLGDVNLGVRVNHVAAREVEGGEVGQDPEVAPDHKYRLSRSTDIDSEERRKYCIRYTRGKMLRVN